MASHLAEFHLYTLCSNNLYTFPQPRLYMYTHLQGRKNLWDDHWQNALMQFMRGYSSFRFRIQFPSLIVLLLIQSLPCAQCRPDITDFMVWDLSLSVIQGSFSKPVRAKRTDSHFPQTRRMTLSALKLSEEREMFFRASLYKQVQLWKSIKYFQLLFPS